MYGHKQWTQPARHAQQRQRMHIDTSYAQGQEGTAADVQSHTPQVK
jgi:hypothetical protein